MSAVEASCVIPAYESPHLVARALVSALTQREIALEVLVSDDSASLAVRELVAGFAAPALRYLQGPRSGNAVENWNHGLAHARGRTCALLHQDEFFLDPLYLRRAVDALDRTGAPAVVGPEDRPRSRVGIGARWAFDEHLQACARRTAARARALGAGSPRRGAPSARP